MRTISSGRALGAAACLALAAALAAVPAAWADGLEGLAPPGPCAEELDSLRGEPAQGFDPQAFDPSGGPREHFDPRDVAAEGPGSGFTPPEAPSATRGPCEGPAAGCADVFAPRGTGVVVTEPKPGPGDAPVFGGGTGGQP